MAESRVRVGLTASFIERLESIETFLAEADVAKAYDKLLDDLLRTVIPNLRRFPRIGRRYLDKPPQSAEAMAQLAVLSPGAADALREYLHGDHLILYALVRSTVYLLSIRHHRQLSVRVCETVGALKFDEREARGCDLSGCKAAQGAADECRLPGGPVS